MSQVKLIKSSVPILSYQVLLWLGYSSWLVLAVQAQLILLLVVLLFSRIVLFINSQFISIVLDVLAWEFGVVLSILVLDVDVRVLGHSLLGIKQVLLIVLCVKVAIVGFSWLCVHVELASLDVVAVSSLCCGWRIETHSSGTDGHALIQSPVSHHGDHFSLGWSRHATAILVDVVRIASPGAMARGIPLRFAVSSLLQPLSELIDPLWSDVWNELSVHTSPLRAASLCRVPLPLWGAFSGLKLVLKLLEFLFKLRVVHLFLIVAISGRWRVIYFSLLLSLFGILHFEITSMNKA